MKLIKKVLILATLAAAGVSASAANADWGSLDSYGPNGAEVRAKTDTAGAVDDFYSFTLAAGDDVLSIVNYYTAKNNAGVNRVDLANATLTLWEGTYGDGIADTKVAWESFGTDETSHTFSGLTGTSYYFEVSGTAGPIGSDYYLNVAANNPNPPSVVPEPANMSLLLAGVGMFGLMMKRRNKA